MTMSCNLLFKILPYLDIVSLICLSYTSALVSALFLLMLCRNFLQQSMTLLIFYAHDIKYLSRQEY